MLRPLACLVLLAPLLTPAGCAGTDRSGYLADFASGRFEEARLGYEAELAKGGKEITLDRVSAATAALSAGDVEGAHRLFREAYDDMDDLTSTTGETVGAVVGSESSKRWKGDPYDRCMTSYYLGLTFWLLGDVDNAAASFKGGLLFDADSAQGANQSDFGLLWFLASQAQRDAAHSDRGAFAFARARELIEERPWLREDVAARANVLVVVDLGFGPKKVATGDHGSELRFAPAAYSSAFAQVSAGGTSLGRTARAVDLYHQATTRGDKVIDHINQGKAVFKDASVIGGAFVLANSGSSQSDVIGIVMMLVGIFLPADADARTWDTLPGEVHVLLGHLEPGEHDVRIDVRDRAGNPLPYLSSTHRTTVRPGRLSLIWARGLPPAQAAPEAPVAGAAQGAPATSP